MNDTDNKEMLEKMERAVELLREVGAQVSVLPYAEALGKMPPIDAARIMVSMKLIDKYPPQDLIPADAYGKFIERMAQRIVWGDHIEDLTADETADETGEEGRMTEAEAKERIPLIREKLGLADRGQGWDVFGVPLRYFDKEDLLGIISWREEQHAEILEKEKSNAKFHGQLEGLSGTFFDR